MMKMKYLMFDQQGLMWPLLFPHNIDHKTMYDANEGHMGKLVSAGSVIIGLDGRVATTGESVTLFTSSRKEDGPIIEKFMQVV